MDAHTIMVSLRGGGLGPLPRNADQRLRLERTAEAVAAADGRCAAVLQRSGPSRAERCRRAERGTGGGEGGRGW